MYPNQMQQRPPGMMHTTSMPQPNQAMGVPTMRSMVAPNPMQTPMIQQQPSPQSSMMVRAAGSPYGVMNRAPIFDKNKRSVYSNDLRQQPPQMGYGNVMGPSQPMMSNAVPSSSAGPIRPQ